MVYRGEPEVLSKKRRCDKQSQTSRVVEVVNPVRPQANFGFTSAGSGTRGGRGISKTCKTLEALQEPPKLSE